MFRDTIILLCGLMFMLVPGVLDKSRAEERYDGHGDDVRTEECDHHCKRESRE
jgi:hypothetical protein